MDFFSSLASQRSPITTFLVLVLFCILLFISWPAVKYPYKLESRYRIRAYWLILIYFVFAMNDGDWFHLYNLFQESTFRTKEASEITSQSAGLELAYFYIAKYVSFNYILFRLVVWGAIGVLCYRIGNRFEVNKSLYLFFFIIIALDIFSFQRGALAMALSFLGYSYIIKPFKNIKILSLLLGVFLIVFSTYFHKSAFFLIPVFLLSFLRFSKRTVIMLIVIIPGIIYFVDSYLADFLMGLGTDSTILNTTVLQGYLTVNNRHFGIGSIIRSIILPLMFVSLFWYIFKQVIIKNTPLPKPIIRMFNCACVIIISSFLLLTLNSLNVSMLYLRLLYFSVIPLTIVISYIYNLYKNPGPTKLFIVICITCSLYKIVLNLLGTIFLGTAGAT